MSPRPRRSLRIQSPVAPLPNTLYIYLTYRYNDKTLYIIDVSQSVEHDHPRSLEFLRMDIKNVTDYFRKKSVSTLSERTCFEFITSDTPLSLEEMESRIEELMQRAEKEISETANQGEVAEGDTVEEGLAEEQRREEREGEKEVEERVFRQAYMPQNLFEVVDPERDVGIIERGGKDDLIYAKFLNVQETKALDPKAAEEVDPAKDNISTEDPEESEESDDEDDETDSEDEQKPRGKRHEDKEAKKERKLKVKEEARERRKNKIPKSEKKRKIKVTKGKK